MKRTFALSAVIVFLLPAFLMAQLGIGEWGDFLPYKRGQWVTQSEETVFYSTEYSILALSKEDQNPTFIGKLQGLTDVGVSKINYDIANEQLIIVYTNSNIDVYTPLEITNLPDIKNNTNIVGSKRIVDIHIFDENSAFLATSFGIVELNLKTLDFGSTIFTDFPINDISSDGTKLYAATEDGLYAVNTAEVNNIADFSRWEKLTTFGTELVETTEENVYTVSDEELYVSVAGGTFEFLDRSEFDNYDFAFLSNSNDGLLIGLETDSPNSQTYSLTDDLQITRVDNGCQNYTLYGIQDELDRYWFADRWAKFRFTDEEGSCKTLEFDTPNDAKVSDIEVKNGSIYLATGGADPENGFKLVGNESGMYKYDGDTWEIFSKQTYDPFKDNGFSHVFQVEAHPANSKVYIGSYYEGIIEYDTETGEHQYFDDETSKLQGVVGDPNIRERISGMAFDQSGNLWINNYGAPEPLVVYTAEGTWHSFDVNSVRTIAKCIIDDNGYIWSIIVNGSNGVLVYDDNRSPNDPSDDVNQRIISASNSEIEGSVTSLAMDLDGQIWVGTENGPVIFDGGQGIFDPNNRGTRRQVLQDSIAAFLLETEDIRSIAVDGANRKWFGTRNGIFVQSPDGKDQIAHFTTTNSPLFNDVIKDLKYDGATGNMYIGTEYGLQVYRTETLTAKNSHANNVYAFPNPVRPEYNGDIFIKGLARDANVKITDLNGKLVYETESLGGLASWDGRDYNGRRAASGVYLVFSTGTQSFDTPDSFVTKILIVN